MWSGDEMVDRMFIRRRILVDRGKKSHAVQETRPEIADEVAPDRDATIAEMHAKGEALKTIGEAVNLPPFAVASILRKLQRNQVNGGDNGVLGRELAKKRI